MMSRAILALLVASFLFPGALAFANPTALQDPPKKQDPEKKGPLAVLRDKIIALEKTHRQNMDALEDALYEAQQAGDEEEIAVLQKRMDKEREAFRKNAAALQEQIKAKVNKAGFDEYLAEHRKVRKEFEDRLKTLRNELNTARAAGDTERIAAVKTKIDKLQKAFVEKLRNALEKIRASDESSGR